MNQVKILVEVPNSVKMDNKILSKEEKIED
jgi:hypothetical protein